jgi:hypothetical protein
VLPTVIVRVLNLCMLCFQDCCYEYRDEEHQRLIQKLSFLLSIIHILYSALIAFAQSVISTPPQNPDSSPFFRPFLLLLNQNIQPLTTLKELPRLLCDVLGIHNLGLRTHNALDGNKTKVDAGVGVSAREGGDHVALGGFDEGEGEELGDGVPGEVAWGCE